MNRLEIVDSISKGSGRNPEKESSAVSGFTTQLRGGRLNRLQHSCSDPLQPGLFEQLHAFVRPNLNVLLKVTITPASDF